MNSIFTYTLRSLNRFGLKNFLIASIFAFLVWLLSSVMLITNSLKYELHKVASNSSEIIINRQIGGRYGFLTQNDIEPLWEIPGISYVKGRVWGQYHFEPKNIYLTLVGVNPFEEHYNKQITQIANIMPTDTKYPPIYLSKSIDEMLKMYKSSKNIITLQKHDKKFEKFQIAGEFKSQTELMSNDVILMPTENVREILGIEEGKYTDMIVKIANPNEIAFIAAKIMYLFPDLKVISKEEILKDYELLYQYKSGWFLMIYIVSFFTFAIILYDKATGLRSEEKREIGILKALGWEINHIIYYKLLEAMILSFFAYFIGVTLAIFYVFILQAPGLKYVFTGYSELKQSFDLPFMVNIKLLALLFFSSVPLYIAASIIPSWKASIKDAAEVMR